MAEKGQVGQLNERKRWGQEKQSSDKGLDHADGSMLHCGSAHCMAKQQVLVLWRGCQKLL